VSEAAEVTWPHPVLVVIPTYDEALTLPSILDRVRAAVPSADVLVVDDASPDGTAAIAAARAADDPGIHVLDRPGKGGLGAAYVAGFGWGLERGYEVFVEMDADGSHAPEQLPRLLGALGWADLVIGSRYVPGGAVVNWPGHRLLLSRGGNLYTRLAVRLPVADATAGYRAYRRHTLEAIGLDQVESQGYCFQVDMTRRTAMAGLRVVEVPITFTERSVGESKMSSDIVREALWRVTQWGARDRLDATRRAIRSRRPSGGIDRA
jgi:glycosyltransferase involved in cell wall biosynthesis